MPRLFKRLDEVGGYLLANVLRALCGTFFYVCLITVVFQLVLAHHNEFRQWYADLLFYQADAAADFNTFAGAAAGMLGALLYLIIPIRQFAILLLPWIFFVGGGIIIAVLA
ncbi:MAG: hypothetical protein CME36_11045 [unclassified Hahellaceae]|nr:hypothetical protein [Hahellaceae bacterium]|tara:strand:+ start:6624 stop:6956 length:333 start_codon:yes stop_codon:yes gene_type:complete